MIMVHLVTHVGSIIQSDVVIKTACSVNLMLTCQLSQFATNIPGDTEST